MEDILVTTVKVVIEAILVSGILGYFFLNREERLKRTIEAEFKTEVKHVFTSNFPHKAEQAFGDKYEAYRRELEIEGSLN